MIHNQRESIWRERRGNWHFRRGLGRYIDFGDAESIEAATAAMIPRTRRCHLAWRQFTTNEGECS
jgi:hypothetical protein